MIVVTLGGNAILPPTGAGTIEEQIAITTQAMSAVADLIASGERVVLSHGNGPIVGNIIVRNEAARDTIPPMPLDVNELTARGVRRPVVSVVTQCVVDSADPAMTRPTKPIGPFYAAVRARELESRKGWVFREDRDRGFRRVVPSPRPVEIVEWEAIRSLVNSGAVVIAAGGGGVPVVRSATGCLRGVEAVIDKDRAAAVLGRQLGARQLVNLTNVDGAALDFGSPRERLIERMTVSEARRHLDDGQFPPGSMGPKIEASIDFVEGGGEEAIITVPPRVLEAMAHRTGTRVVPDGERSS
jgi:carbamate kinase